METRSKYHGWRVNQAAVAVPLAALLGAPLLLVLPGRPARSRAPMSLLERIASPALSRSGPWAAASARIGKFVPHLLDAPRRGSARLYWRVANWIFILLSGRQFRYTNEGLGAAQWPVGFMRNGGPGEQRR